MSITAPHCRTSQATWAPLPHADRDERAWAHRQAAARLLLMTSMR